MADFICLVLGMLLLAGAIWLMVNKEKYAKFVAVGVMAVPAVPLLIYGFTSHDAGKALICLITAATYGCIMYATFFKGR